MNKQTVTKSNALVQAGYRLTLNEQRLILACIAQINTSTQATDVLPRLIFRVEASDFAKAFGLDPRLAYRVLQEAVANLWNRSVKTYDGRYTKEVRWVDMHKYEDGRAYAEISFTHWVAPYLTQLRQHFTSYHLAEVANFKSPHAIRVYELLMQFKGQGKRLIALDDFKTWLCLTDAYPKFSDLKRWVLDPAVREINRHNPALKVTWAVMRKKRVPYLLEFTFTPS